MNNWGNIVYNKKNKQDKPKKNEKAGSNNFDSNSTNTIYFYSGVSDESVFDLNKEIEKKSKELTIMGISCNIPPPPLNIKIHSYGGSVFSAFAAMNYIENCNVETRSYIDGAAASAATLMSVVANKRYIARHGYMLIHQLSAWTAGTYEELKDDMKNNESLMEKIYNVYEAKTRIPKAKLKEVLKRDLWWDAETCLKYGLVDEIV